MFLFCCIDLFLGLWGLFEIPVHECITFCYVEYSVLYLVFHIGLMIYNLRK
ncbi:hypothetical protein Sjap_006497 [Stephania japonica]|uniref:Uncharacterized protein n=1 Tax=Stephania japonica TaxID=461633 RepID=A0AAP0K7K3_9MAGN